MRMAYRGSRIRANVQTYKIHKRIYICYLPFGGHVQVLQPIGVHFVHAKHNTPKNNELSAKDYIQIELKRREPVW